jgi:FO synthase
MQLDEIAAWSRRGRDLGCAEALMCLGDKPELAFPRYRALLADWGYASTAAYVERACETALDCGLLPHTNAGILTRDEMERLRRVNVSLGLMLENVSPRLRGRGEVHQWGARQGAGRSTPHAARGRRARDPVHDGSPDRHRRNARRARGHARRHSRSARTYGHVQEVIVQNFRAKPTMGGPTPRSPTRSTWPAPVAVARLVLDDEVSVQSAAEPLARRSRAAARRPGS